MHNVDLDSLFEDSETDDLLDLEAESGTTPESESELEPEPEPEQESETELDVFRFTVNDELKEYTPEQILRLEQERMGQAELTRKLQYYSDWVQKHQRDLEDWYSFNEILRRDPVKARQVAAALYGQQMEAQAQAQAQAKSESVDQLLNEQQQQSQAKVQYTPEQINYLRQLHAQQHQMAQYIQMQEQEKINNQFNNHFDSILEKYGVSDSDTEKSILEWMLYLKTNDPEVAIKQMLGEYAMRQPEPVIRPYRKSPPAPVIESGRRSTGRGVKANPATMQRQRRPKSYEEAAKRSLSSWTD